MKTMRVTTALMLSAIATMASSQTAGTAQPMGRAPDGAPGASVPKQGGARAPRAGTPGSTGSTGNSNQTDSNSTRPSAAKGGSPHLPSKVRTNEAGNASSPSAGKTSSGPAGRGGAGEPSP